MKIKLKIEALRLDLGVGTLDLLNLLGWGGNLFSFPLARQLGLDIPSFLLWAQLV